MSSLTVPSSTSREISPTDLCICYHMRVKVWHLIFYISMHNAVCVQLVTVLKVAHTKLQELTAASFLQCSHSSSKQ